MPVEITDRFERWRIRHPALFIPSSFRTHDIGRIGYSKRIAGRLRSNGNWATQSILISHSEPPAMKRRLRQIAKDLVRQSRRR